MTTETVYTTTLQPYLPGRSEWFPIDSVARLAGMPRHRVLVCCKRGIISPHIDPESGRYSFDGATIRVLQRVEYLLTECEVNYTGIQIILSLADEVERFRELEAFRRRSWSG